MYSCPVLLDEESQNWPCSFRTATNAMYARAQQFKQVTAKIQRDLDLVGVIGVEHVNKTKSRGL